ncbi:MAG: c-type cytochrome [Bryobacteraceae bacterium]|nr:c-type cytochrome [Bryobacteraceae bacterium]MDW8378374.1 c-type cytochrome [Bryobacterales bacterium]
MALSGGFAQTAPEKVAPLSSATAEDLARGKRLYDSQCSQCHGPKGDGGTGANLAQPSLRLATTDEALVRIIREGIPGTDMPATPAMTEHEWWLTAAYVRTLGKIPPEKIAGDPERGKLIFTGKGGCTACHSIHGRGGRFGPELGDIGARRSASHLRQSVLAPDADFTERYAFVRARLASGETLSGIRLNEDTFSIQFMDASERIHSFWKKDLAQLEILRNYSPMPPYAGRLSATELDDLVAYLVSLRGSK